MSQDELIKQRKDSEN